MQASSSPPPAPLDASSGKRDGLLLLAGTCSLLSAALLVLVALEWGPLLAWDRSMAEGLHRSAVEEPGWVHANRILTDWVWDPWTMRALMALAALLLVRRGGRTTALWVLLVMVTGSVLQQGMKSAVGRERPRWPDPVDSAHYASFPSGHAMTAALACGVLLWLLRGAGVRSALLLAAVALAALSVAGVGFARLYLGVHWPTDVLGGWLLGAGLAAGSIAAYDHWRRAAGRTADRGLLPGRE